MRCLPKKGSVQAIPLVEIHDAQQRPWEVCSRDPFNLVFLKRINYKSAFVPVTIINHLRNCSLEHALGNINLVWCIHLLMGKLKHRVEEVTCLRTASELVVELRLKPIISDSQPDFFFWLTMFINLVLIQWGPRVRRRHRFYLWRGPERVVRPLIANIISKSTSSTATGYMAAEEG